MLLNPLPLKIQVPTRFRSAGFTLIEVMIVVALVGTLASIAIPGFLRLASRAEIDRAVNDIKVIEADIAVFEFANERLPTDLSEINRSDLKDPWGNPYEYLSFAAGGPKGKVKARKDHSLHPLNTSYDLYSKGKDGVSVAPLTASASRDDIIRANDGGFVGLASEY